MSFELKTILSYLTNSSYYDTLEKLLDTSLSHEEEKLLDATIKKFFPKDQMPEKNKRIEIFKVFLKSEDGRKYLEALRCLDHQSFLANRLGLHLIPAETQMPKESLQNLYRSKRIFLMKSIPHSSQMKRINKLTDYLFMQRAIQELSLTYEKWEDDADFLKFKNTLNFQHENLKIIADLFPKKNPFDPQLDVYFDSIEDNFKDCIEGKSLISRELSKKIRLAIKAGLNNPNFITRSELKKRRSRAPITCQSVEMQSEAFEVLRLAKLNTTDIYLHCQGNNNWVYKVDLEGKNERFAFLKKGNGNKNSTGVMEKLMWDVACILGVEAYFTPTRIIKGQGSIQPEQKDHSLRHLSRTGLITGTLISIVFGMSDLHDKNIIVNKRGDIKFFDNSRSLPVGNGIIFSSGFFFLTYRSHLLSLEGSYQSLTNKEKRFIYAKIREIQSRIPMLEKYFQNSLTKSQLACLSTGWWNTKYSMLALKERLDRLEAGINSKKVNNLRDLIFELDPKLKFIAAIKMFNHLKLYRGMVLPYRLLELQLLPVLRIDCVQEYLNQVKDWFNLEKFYKLCEEPKLYLEDVVKIMLDEYRTNNFLKTEHERFAAYIATFKNLFKQSRYQCVDVVDSLSFENLPMTILDNFGLYGIKAISGKVSNLLIKNNLWLMGLPNICFHADIDATNFCPLILYYMNKEHRLTQIQVDYLSVLIEDADISHFRIRGIKMNSEDIKNAMINLPFDATVDTLIDAVQNNQFLEAMRNLHARL